MNVGEAKSLLIESDIYLSLGLTNFRPEEVCLYQIIKTLSDQEFKTSLFALLSYFIIKKVMFLKLSFQAYELPKD